MCDGRSCTTCVISAVRRPRSRRSARPSPTRGAASQLLQRMALGPDTSGESEQGRPWPDSRDLEGAAADDKLAESLALEQSAGAEEAADNDPHPSPENRPRHARLSPKQQAANDSRSVPDEASAGPDSPGGPPPRGRGQRRRKKRGKAP